MAATAIFSLSLRWRAAAAAAQKTRSLTRRKVRTRTFLVRIPAIPATTHTTLVSRPLVVLRWFYLGVSLATLLPHPPGVPFVAPKIHARFRILRPCYFPPLVGT